MRQLITLLPALALVAGWYFLEHHKVEWSIKPRTQQAAGPAQAGAPPVRPGAIVRIASFNIQVFGETKLADVKTADVLARIIRKFDLVAVQEVRDRDPAFLARFLQRVNAGGAQYNYVIGPRLGRTDSKEQYAFLYDMSRIELDPSSVYTVRDPDDLLHREPLVAGFRCRAAPPAEAFTFTLVDVHTDPDDATDECDALADAFRAVRDDGRGEDDVILLGDFNADDRRLGRLRALPFISYVFAAGTPTNTRGTHTYDNILFDRRATVEFSGGYGVLDVVREFNLTLDEALKVSDHLPVWAEFSVYEGGRPGNVAAKPR